MIKETNKNDKVVVSEFDKDAWLSFPPNANVVNMVNNPVVIKIAQAKNSENTVKK